MAYEDKTNVTYVYLYNLTISHENVAKNTLEYAKNGAVILRAPNSCCSRPLSSLYCIRHHVRFIFDHNAIILLYL